MSDLNILSATGRLVRDPDLRRAESGNLWGLFTIASNFHYKAKNGNFAEEVAYIPCKVFGRLAETLAKHKKGEMALLSGRLKSESWEKDGRTQWQLVVVCDSLKFIHVQNGSSAPMSGEEVTVPPGREGNKGDDDNLPF